MTGKDYYKILEVSPGATPLAIKKAYRRLAIKYHPDTNAGNNIYEQKFKELNEAYRVLSDAQRRNEYNNAQSSKQHAHARRQYNAKPASETVTIHTILLEAKRLKTKTAASDPDRMNKAALFRQVEHLLTRKNVRVLQEGHDEKVNATFVECIIFVCAPLPFYMVREIIHPLLQIAGTNNELFTRIREFEKKSKVNTIWNDYKLVIAFLLALLFCILIYFISE